MATGSFLASSITLLGSVAEPPQISTLFLRYWIEARRDLVDRGVVHGGDKRVNGSLIQNGN